MNILRFGVLAVVVAVKNTVSWDVMLHSLTPVYHHVGGTSCLLLHDGRNWGSWFLQNISKFLPDSTVGAGRAPLLLDRFWTRYWTWPSRFGFGHGINIHTLQKLNYLETLASGRPWPKNRLKHLRRKRRLHCIAAQKTVSFCKHYQSFCVPGTLKVKQRTLQCVSSSC